MNSLGEGIAWSPTPVAAIVGLVAVLGTTVLCWLAWSRSGFRRSTGALELLRLVLVGLVVVTLCQPEWLTYPLRQRVPSLVVLWDGSRSMETRDVLTQADSNPRSRAEAIGSLKEPAYWDPEPVAGAFPYQVLVESFAASESDGEAGTDLNQALMRQLDANPDLRGVVLISDGDWNLGASPAQAAMHYRMRKVPVFAVAAGSAAPLPDLELVSMDAPTFAVAGKPLRIPFVVGSALGQDRDVVVTLKMDGASAVSKSVRVPAMKRAQDALVWNPVHTGDFALRLEIGSDPSDRVADNNVIEGPILVRQEALKVLVIESYPRWEYRYLRNALERDPGVEVTCLLYHQGLSKVGGGRTYIKQFPSVSELNRFDVVFLGDVGVSSTQLTLEQVRDLKQLVSSQAAGLVFLPGRYGYQDSLVEGPLADLYPVVVDRARVTGVGSGDKGHFALTEAGRGSLLTKLADSEAANADVWRRLPGFNWYAAVERAKRGTEVLAVHDRETSAVGRIPLIVTKTYGTGKVLFMGCDGAWRWREGVEDRYHYRFWGQVARWMAYQRQKAQGESMRLFCSPDRPQVDEGVTLSANVLDALGGFLAESSVTVEAVAPSGKSRTIRLKPGEGDAIGLYSGAFVVDEPGSYRLVATSDTGATMEMELPVQGRVREQVGRPTRVEVLEEIASVSGGGLFELGAVGDLKEQLAAAPEREETMRRTRLWAHPAWCGFLIFLMGLFWVGRKLAGTV